jgi:hypothetical protein
MGCHNNQIHYVTSNQLSEMIIRDKNNLGAPNNVCDHQGFGSVKVILFYFKS